MGARSFAYRVLQTGALPLRPDHSIDERAEHVCTSVLVWPDGERPSKDNTVVTDPCFPRRGWQEAQAVLGELGLGLGDLALHFVTHEHHDHLWNVPTAPPVAAPWWFFPPAAGGPLAGLEGVPCPGHSEDMTALVFRSGADRVWIVGDAVLDADWLDAWGYYWPNGYTPDEVRQTWRSVASILQGADVIVPGHGPPLRVTAERLQKLLDRWPLAPHAGELPDVTDALRRRRDAMG